MENLKEKVDICCVGDEKVKDDFYKALNLIFEINSAGFVLNSQEEALSIFISRIIFYVRRNPTSWEADVKKEFTESLIEMASSFKWGKRVNLEAREALKDLCLAQLPTLKETEKRDRWFDWEQSSYLEYLLDKEEAGDYKSQEARKALHL
jgi:hypothetical protein